MYKKNMKTCTKLCENRIYKTKQTVFSVDSRLIAAGGQQGVFSGAVGPEAGSASLGLEAEMLENILVRRLADLTAVLGLGWAASRQVVPDADVSVA